MSRWGLVGPPADAYFRVTNAERFRPLHGFAGILLDRLYAEFDVDREDEPGLDPELEQVGTLSIVRLTPRAENAASLTIGFTTFPGLNVRFGRWHTRPFPACGCDACDETFESESGVLSWMITQLADGRYREELQRSERGKFTQRHEFWSDDGRRAGGSQDRTEGDDTAALKPGVVAWQPWPRRSA
jgi:hypothetical protein